MKSTYLVGAAIVGSMALGVWTLLVTRPLHMQNVLRHEIAQAVHTAKAIRVTGGEWNGGNEGDLISSDDASWKAIVGILEGVKLDQVRMCDPLGQPSAMPDWIRIEVLSSKPLVVLFPSDTSLNVWIGEGDGLQKFCAKARNPAHTDLGALLRARWAVRKSRPNM